MVNEDIYDLYFNRGCTHQENELRLGAISLGAAEWVIFQQRLIFFLKLEIFAELLDDLLGLIEKIAE